MERLCLGVDDWNHAAATGNNHRWDQQPSSHKLFNGGDSLAPVVKSQGDISLNSVRSMWHPSVRNKKSGQLDNRWGIPRRGIPLWWDIPSVGYLPEVARPARQPRSPDMDPQSVPDVEQMLFYWRANVTDVGPPLKQHLLPPRPWLFTSSVWEGIHSKLG